MRFNILLLAIFFLSCKPKQKVYYHSFGKNSVVVSYNLKNFPKFVKNTNFDLGDKQDSGLVIKKYNKFKLVNAFNIDTLFVYYYSSNIKGIPAYQVDFSNLSVSRNNRLGLKLTQNDLQINVNGKPLKELINIKSNLVNFKDSLIYIEAIDSNGIKVRDYVKLEFNKTLIFKKLEEIEEIDIYFRVSLNGRKIYMYRRFIGTSKYFSKKFKSRSMVYKIE